MVSSTTATSKQTRGPQAGGTKVKPTGSSPRSNNQESKENNPVTGEKKQIMSKSVHGSIGTTAAKESTRPVAKPRSTVLPAAGARVRPSNGAKADVMTKSLGPSSLNADKGNKAKKTGGTATAPKRDPAAGIMSKSVTTAGDASQKSGAKSSATPTKPTPKTRPGTRTSTSKSTKQPPASAVFHEKQVLHDSDEDETAEELHPAILKQARQSGSLNLSNKGLQAIPKKVYSINDPDANANQKRGFSIDRVDDQENWWDQVDLTKLILASNQISRVSSKIGNLKSLTVLDLHDNNIKYLPDEIGLLENLVKINLSHNGLTFLPMRFFDLANLRGLNASHNEINQFDQDLERLNMLETLDLAHNKLTEITTSLACLSKLKNFTMNNNVLETIPHEISFLRSVTLIELSNNQLVEIPDDALQDMHSLERLYLHHNKLKAIPNLRNCLNLKELHIGFNFVEEFTAENIENLPNVTTLDLRDNKIPLLPDEIINLQGLERLDVSNNDLSTLPFTLGTLPHLKSLQVDGNPMRSIRRDIIQRGTNGLLKYLKSRIDEEEMTRLRDKGNISPVPSGGSSPIPDKYVMKSAQVMNLSGKEIAVLAKEAVENAAEAEVTGVDLSKNHFEKFPSQLEPIMPQLVQINMASNRLTVLPSSSMSLGAKLQYINFAGNRLTSLPIEIGLLTNLREVCLNCNRFESGKT